VDAQTDAVIRYIDANQADPFYLFVSYLEPHHQNHLDDYPPPDGYRERYTTNTWVPPDLAALGGTTHQHLAGYYGMVKRLDEALGRTMDALKSLDLLDDTIILFTSDHACHFKTRNSEYKRTGHESGSRVPTAFHGGVFNGGGEINELVSLIDLPPTLLDAAGIPVPDYMSGSSILPLLKGERDGWQEEAFIQISESQIGRAIRTQRWKYGVKAPQGSHDGAGGSSVYEEEYLYDLQADPYELRNLVNMESHAPVCEVMKERLIRRMVEDAGENAPEIRPHERQRAGQRTVSEAEARM
ncbi:MAG: sulfatase-like hydrolase/transferase, partial [Candidatus Poribacteria bacterium]|nr:sulfatase-like hydrolase/transferase [Candidatus Poribacteria bacterium]